MSKDNKKINSSVEELKAQNKQLLKLVNAYKNKADSLEQQLILSQPDQEEGK
jgi:predicted RNase H-like nuclease (RuvC/YqgF family)